MASAPQTVESVTVPTQNLAFVHFLFSNHLTSEYLPHSGCLHRCSTASRMCALEKRSVPTEVGENDVLVALKAISVCGSDIHFLCHGGVGDYVARQPLILGHETADVVIKVGSNVTNVKAGDRVALEPGASCRTCFECKSGVYQHCEHMVFAASPPYNGTLAGFYTLPSDLCYPLPANLTLEEGALLEPMSVGVHALHNIAQMQPASRVVIFGAGPVGLLTAAAAKGLGAARVIAVDIQEPRLKFAKESGLVHDYFLPPKPNEGEAQEDYPARQARKLRERFGFTERGANGVDLVVCIQTAIHLLKHGGTLVQVGMGQPDVTIPMHRVLAKELTIKGSFRYGSGSYLLAMDLVARGAVNLKSIISHRYTFGQALEAYRDNQAGVSKRDGMPVIKCVIAGPTDKEAETLLFDQKLTA
ncbi:hypothetical protein JCM8547_004058 [Rhodosporidiobolus lusitaniae]